VHGWLEFSFYTAPSSVLEVEGSENGEDGDDGSESPEKGWVCMDDLLIDNEDEERLEMDTGIDSD
jgi:hypothetical protein